MTACVDWVGLVAAIGFFGMALCVGIAFVVAVWRDGL